MIKVDTVYAYPYKGLWFEESFQFKRFFNFEKAYKIKVTISNQRKRKAYFYMMTCSKIDNLRIDNEFVNFRFWGCDSNFSVQHELIEGESYSFFVEVINSFNYYTNKTLIFRRHPGQTRLGLVLINDIYDKSFIHDDFERMRNKNKWTGIVWSNILNL